MIVYRVENENHEGPFTFSPSDAKGLKHAWMKLLRALTAIHDIDIVQFPNITSDGIVQQLECTYDMDYLVCGCDSMEQLAHWFFTPKLIYVLKRAGFNIRKYTVPDGNCFYGNSLKQVAFFLRGGYEYPNETLDMMTLRSCLWKSE